MAILTEIADPGKALGGGAAGVIGGKSNTP